MVQTYQPLTNAPYYTPGQDGGGTQINIELNHSAHSPTLVVQATGVTSAFSITSGQKVNGRAWLLGNVTTPGDEFLGHTGQVAMWYSGWVFRPSFQGELVWDLANKQLYFLDSFASSVPVLRPINAPLTSGTQIDTGRTDGGGTPKIIYSKLIAFGAGPNNTTKNVAHGVTSLPVAKGARLFVNATSSDGTTARPLPYHDGTNIAQIRIDATNVIVQTNFNLSGSDIVAEVGYAK